MTEKPREYKKRIDKTRAKMRENRDELIDYIDEYELVDEKYKAETKQEILASFDKNEKAEKSSELYIKIGEELANIEQKYKELEELKEKLEAKRNERETLKNELKVQNIDGDDKTTLKMQMQKIKSINSKIEEIDVESKELEKRIEEREKEIKEIEETYGKKEDTGEISIKEEKEQGITNPQEETTKKENSRTLQEYKETVLFEKLRIGSIRGKIIELLEEGTGIDEILKEKIKGKISDVFEKYNDEISGSLRMKSAEYMEDRDAILNLDTAFRIKSINGKKCFMLGKEQYSDWFDDIDGITGIGGKPCFKAKKDGKWCVMRGKEQQGGWFDELEGLKEVGGKLCFIAKMDGKKCQMRGGEQQGGWFDDIKDPKEIGGKILFRAQKDGKRCIMRGNEQYSDWFKSVGVPKEICGKIMFGIEREDGKGCIMLGQDQYSDGFDHIYNLQEIGGKPCFIVQDGEYGKNGKYSIMRGKEQYSEWFDYIRHTIIDISGRLAYIAKKDGKYCIMRGKELYSEWFDEIGDLQEIGGKPCFIAEKDGRRYTMRGKEQQGEGKIIESYAKEKMDELRTKSDEEDMEKTPREQREKIILDRYQKKLNRDELLKIISGSDVIDKETKKTLKSEILSDFYAEFEKVTSTKEFQGIDKEYRELKKAERKKTKKSAELEKQKEKLKPEVAKLDEKLFEIANSAMKLEDDSRMKIIKSKRLNKAKEEWNTLENRLNEILDKVTKLHNEGTELIGIYKGKEKKYGKKGKRSEIKGRNLIKGEITTDKLESYTTLIGHKKAYMELVEKKEKYINDLLQQIETIDFGISEGKKKDVIEKLNISLKKELELFKEGDEITKLANETEKWLNENWKGVIKQISDLKGKIDGKEKEISELKLKQIGDDSNEIYKTKEKEFELRDELLDLKDQYNTIKTDLEEKIKKYDGTIIDWTDQIRVETRDEKIEREERERKEREREEREREREEREREKIKIELKVYHEAWKEKIDLNQEIKELIIKAAEKFIVKIETDSEGSRLITIKFGNKKYKILDPILDKHSSSDEDYSHMVDDSKQLIKKERRHVYSRGMIGDLDKRENVPLRDYVKQKQNEGLHLAKMDEINELLKALGDMAGLEDTKSQIAMLMYLTGINGAYRVFSDKDQPNKGICFDKSLVIKQCDNSCRLNLLMINATE